MLHRLRRWIPSSWLRPYHFALAHLAAFLYRYPSNDLIVIGVTGTTGKTTTSYFIAKALEAAGYPTGCTTTALLKIGEKEWLNRSKMTMPGRFFLQRMLRQMVDAGCRYAVVEVTSQGMMQYRHHGIAFDVAVFTNLSPEHIESHGGFEPYKRAKRLLFERLVALPPKHLQGNVIPRVGIMNGDSPHAEYYAATPGLTHVEWYGFSSKKGLTVDSVSLDATGSQARIAGHTMHLNIVGRHNLENALAALTVCQALGIDIQAAMQRLESIERVPGRLEFVSAGQPWHVVVDYAHEPESMRRLYEALTHIPHRRLIHVLGSCGGGRDVARRPVLGELAGKMADEVIVTNEDPYDDDPRHIADQVLEGVLRAGKSLEKNARIVLDRREAIMQAMRLAASQDIVLITGKGCEPWMCVANGKKIPWDDREIAKEAIKAVTHS